MGQIATFDMDGNVSPPSVGVMVYFNPSYDTGISFQSVLPFYRSRGFVDPFGGLYIGGYLEFSSGGPRDILMLQLGRTLGVIRSYRYYFNDTSDEVIYRLFKDGKTQLSNITNYHVVGIGYTTYHHPSKPHMDKKNILVFGVDSTLKPSFSCIYGGLGDDIGMYLYKQNDSTYIVLGYSDSYTTSGNYGIYVAKINTNDCRPYWVRIFYDTLISLIPYAISKNIIIPKEPVDGGIEVFHITGTAICNRDTLNCRNYNLFLLTIDSNGNFVNFTRYYVPTTTVPEYPDNLLGFESIVYKGDIIVVGETRADVIFNTSLPRLTTRIYPLSEERGKAFAMRLTPDGLVLWAKEYFSWAGTMDPARDQGIFFSLDKIDDGTFVAGGEVVNFQNYTLENMGAKIKFSNGEAEDCTNDIYPILISHTLKFKKDTVYDKVGGTLILRDLVGISYSRLSMECFTCDFEFCGAVFGRSGPMYHYEKEHFDFVGEFEIYTTSGKFVKRANSYQDVKNLPKGVYMIKRGSKVYKFIRR